MSQKVDQDSALSARAKFMISLEFQDKDSDIGHMFLCHRHRWCQVVNKSKSHQEYREKCKSKSSHVCVALAWVVIVVASP